MFALPATALYVRSPRIHDIVLANGSATQQRPKFHAVAVGERDFHCVSVRPDKHLCLDNVPQLLVTAGIAHRAPILARAGLREVAFVSRSGTQCSIATPDSEEATTILEQAERCRGIVRNLSALAGQSIHPRRVQELEPLAWRVVRGLSAEANRLDVRVVVEPMESLTASLIGP